MAPSISIKSGSQIWSLDLIIAFLIFLGSLLLFYNFSINTVDLEKEDVESILLDAKLISGYLASSGHPEDWTADTVVSIGLTDGDMRLEEEKVKQFSNMASLDYANTQKLLSTTHDYNISFEKDNTSVEIKGVSSIGKDYKTDNPRNLLKVIRFVFYNSSIINMVVHVW